MDNQIVNRKMQRSCTECARRKIKCDHEYPCGTCKRRGQADACRPPDMCLQSTTMPFQIDQDKLALQHRIAMLEAKLGEIHPTSQSNDAEFENPEGLLVMLESLSHGQPPSPTSLSGRSTITPLYQPGKPVFLMLIPEKHSSHQIIDFALANLTWIHCAVRAPQFQLEHLLFWEKVETGNGNGFQNDHGWLSMYFSLLAVGLFYMDPEERPVLPRLNGVEDQSTRQNGESERGVDIARMWYEAAIRELEASSPLTQPSIQSVQTVAILTLAHSHFGQMEQEYLLLGMAINTARCLEMHLLGSEAQFSKRLALKEIWSTPENRQLGRRLWWTLVICDWLGMFTRPSSISPSSFNSALEPMDGDNNDLLLNVNVNGVEATDRSAIRHHAAMSQLASVIYVHIKAPRDLKASRLATVLDKVEAIGESMVNRRVLLSNDVPTWVTAQEYLMQHTINLLSVTMARASLVLWMTDHSGTEDVIERGLNSALKILHMRQQPVPRVYQCHWIISAATLAAGVFLTIHLLCFKKDAVSTTITERRRLIRYCIDALQYPNPQTPLAIQGSQMLEILLQIEMHSLSCDPTNKGALLNRLRMAFQDEGYPFCPVDGYQSMAMTDMETSSHEMGILWPSLMDSLDIDGTCMDDLLVGMDWV